MTDQSITTKLLSLRGIFADSPAFHQLQEQFHHLLEMRRAENEAGIFGEARGIALIGASGSGKTTAVNRLLRTYERPQETDQRSDICEVLSFTVPSPATLKFVGQTGLQAIGYPLRRDKTSQIIWEMFREHLHARRTLFLHLDEAQDLATHQTPREMQSVINTLKSLMQNKQWPVGLILSGMPTLKEMLNHDEQLGRRVFPIEFQKLNAQRDAELVLSTVAYYSGHIDLSIAQGVTSHEFAARLIHAADGEFGLMIECTIAAIEDALRAQESKLRARNFRNAFERKSGCLDGLNPFVAEDFERIDARQLLGGVT